MAQIESVCPHSVLHIPPSTYPQGALWLPGQRPLFVILESLPRIKCSCPTNDCKSTLNIDTMVSISFSVAKDGTQSCIYAEQILFY